MERITNKNFDANADAIIALINARTPDGRQAHTYLQILKILGFPVLNGAEKSWTRALSEWAVHHNIRRHKFSAHKVPCRKPQTEMPGPDTGAIGQDQPHSELFPLPLRDEGRAEALMADKRKFMLAASKAIMAFVDSYFKEK